MTPHQLSAVSAEDHQQKLSPRTADTVAGSLGEPCMNTSLDSNDTTFPVAVDTGVYLGRSLHPGYIDLPFVTEEIFKEGRRDFGRSIAVAELDESQLTELENELVDYERDVRQQIARLRSEIEQRGDALTGQLSFGIAA
jgi:hypothetical protein